MNFGKFCLHGDDKKMLSSFKSILTAGGGVYLGSIREADNILRVMKDGAPDLIVIDAAHSLKQLMPILKEIDKGSLAACILILESLNDEFADFLRQSKMISYAVKPLSPDAVKQVLALALLNYHRVLRYEKKFKELNEQLETRKVVEEAKWLLAEKEGLTETEAYETIRRKSRNNRLPMIKIAEAIILAHKATK